jgi:hypothetical protein
MANAFQRQEMLSHSNNTEEQITTANNLQTA